MQETRSTVYNAHYMDITKRYPDGYFDLLVADVPYGVKVEKMVFTREIKTRVTQKNGKKQNPNRRKIKNPHIVQGWDTDVPGQEYINEAKRVSKNQIIFGVDYAGWKNIGTGRLIWDKCFAKGMSFNRYETAYQSFTEEGILIPLLWADMMQAKSLSEPTTQQGDKSLNEERIHVCHKPILLYDKIFQMFCFKGMKVLDTHLGSGSSRISADKFGVGEFVGIEINKEYVDKHEKRFRQYKSQLSISF